MRFWLRFVANGLVVFLALYLVDTLARGRFRLEATWIAVILAVILSLLNSRIRPLRRLRARPRLALSVTVLTILMNALLLQVFAWAGALVSTADFAWALVPGAFVALLTGTVNWLIGFPSKERPRKGLAEKTDGRVGKREREAEASRAQN